MKLDRSVAPNLEIFEEKVLLSTGIGKPAAAVAIIASKTPKPFKLNGKLPLKLTATYSGVAPGFREKQPFPPMGEKVKVSGTLVYPGSTSSDGLPDLSGSTFELSNASGRLLVTLSSSTTSFYGFTISGGTKRFARADGTTGIATFAVAPKSGFALTFKTTGHSSGSSTPPTNGTLVTLASFDGSSGSNIRDPNARVTLDSQGNLYGTTVNGGVDGSGTVYEIVKGSGAFVTVASFGGTNGALPYGGVTMDAQGNLYGTTSGGGPGGQNAGLGTVWELAKGTDTITTLASFNVATGFAPEAGVTLDAQGDLYGTAYRGGLDNVGTVWELAKGSNTISAIASFNGTNGSNPVYGVTLDAQGNLYGSAGSLWEIAKGSSTIITLDAHWLGPVTIDSLGNFYEAAYSGATHQPFVEEVSRFANGTYGGTKSFSFSGISDFVNPFLVVDAQGNIYGTITGGSGAYGDGMVWEIVKGSDSITTLASFGGTSGSSYSPEGQVTLDADGNLYGTTIDGGADGFGGVWEFVAGALPLVRTTS